jgi:hypothetical protein
MMRLEAVREANAALVVEDVPTVTRLRDLMSTGRDIDQLKEAVRTDEPDGARRESGAASEGGEIFLQLLAIMKPHNTCDL